MQFAGFLQQIKLVLQSKVLQNNDHIALKKNGTIPVYIQATQKLISTRILIHVNSIKA